MNLKKLLSAIGLLAIASPAALSAVACGDDNSEEPTKPTNPDSEQEEANALKSAIDNLDATLSVTTKENTKTQIQEMLDDLKKENSKLSINVTLGDYDLPTANKPTTVDATIVIKNEASADLANTTKQFTLNFAKINLKESIGSTVVYGGESIETEEDLITAVIISNPRVKDVLKNSIKVKEGTFRLATESEYGSGVIIPKDEKNEHLTGETTITIKIDTKLNAIFQKLKDADDSKDQEAKKTAWVEYFNYKIEQLGNDIKAGLVIPEFKQENDLNIRVWVLNDIRELIYHEIDTTTVGEKGNETNIVRDFASYTPTYDSLDFKFNTKTQILTYTQEWRLAYPEDKEDEGVFFRIENWQIHYTVRSWK